MQKKKKETIVSNLYTFALCIPEVANRLLQSFEVSVYAVVVLGVAVRYVV